MHDSRSLPKSEQKRRMCVALLNAERHENGICCHNHEIEYWCGWFSIDGGDPFHRTDITAKADEMIAEGARTRLCRNTWVVRGLVSCDPECPVLQELHRDGQKRSMGA